MLNTFGIEFVREIVGKTIEGKISNWFKDFMEVTFRNDLRCVLYAHLINKSREVSNATDNHF